MKISPKGLDPDIYNLISEDIFELVAYHLLFNSGDTREYQFNKKILSIKNDRNAIKSKIASISKKNYRHIRAKGHLYSQQYKPQDTCNLNNRD
ncbi:hypothetical protein NGY2020031_21940 [Vibrio cholerae]